MAEMLSGVDLSSQIYSSLKEEITTLIKQGHVPKLATILVGNNPASEIYVSNKIKKCKELGIESIHIQLDNDVTTECILKEIEDLILLGVHGILIQTPLPPHINQDLVIESIPPNVDVDGFHSHNIGKLSQNQPNINPCTPLGCMKLLEQVVLDLKGKVATVIGKSNTVGKPMAIMLMNAGATVVSCDKNTKNLLHWTKQSDIIIVACGVPSLITPFMVKPGTIIIDVGINRIEGTNIICGDVSPVLYNIDDLIITPVPGGVGPMTVCMLMFNTVQSCKRSIQEIRQK